MFTRERLRAFEGCGVPHNSYVSDKLASFERQYTIARKRPLANPVLFRRIECVREYTNGAVVVEYDTSDLDSYEWPYLTMATFLCDHDLRKSELRVHLGNSIYWLLFHLAGVDDDINPWHVLPDREPRLERMTRQAIREHVLRFPKVPSSWREKVQKAEDALFNALMRTSYKACVKALARARKLVDKLWLTDAVPATPRVLTQAECVAVARKFSEVVYGTLTERDILRVEIDPANGMERKGLGIITAKRPRIHSVGGLTPDEIATITPLLRDAWVERLRPFDPPSPSA